MSSRRVVLVVGPDGSGASELAGALHALGMRVPGDGWVGDLHGDLLERANVAVDDARPSAWFETGKLAANGLVRTDLVDRVRPDLDGHEAELVVAEPRLAWFLGLWRAAATRLEAMPAFLFAARHPAELATGGDPVGRVASWANLALHTELATRGSARTVVRYDELRVDWTAPLFRAGRELGLRAVTEAASLPTNANRMRAAHRVLGSTLDGATRGWPDLAVPAGLRDLAEATWLALTALAEGDTPELQATLDELRDAYVTRYEEAEALTVSTTEAARREAAAADPPRRRKRLLGR